MAEGPSGSAEGQGAARGHHAERDEYIKSTHHALRDVLRSPTLVTIKVAVRDMACLRDRDPVAMPNRPAAILA